MGIGEYFAIVIAAMRIFETFTKSRLLYYASISSVSVTLQISTSLLKVHKCHVEFRSISIKTCRRLIITFCLSKFMLFPIMTSCGISSINGKYRIGPFPLIQIYSIFPKRGKTYRNRIISLP